MARLNLNKPKSGKKILLVDDKEEYLAATASIISHEGHEVICVKNGEETLDILKKENFDLLLLDYFMPGGMTGEDVVIKLREFNRDIQIILQTGYAGEYPPREMLKKLDIQGYHDKSDGPDKLLLWIDVGLKSAFTINLLNKSRLGLKYILDVTPDLHKIQQIEDLLQGILFQLSGLIGTVNTFLAILSDSDLKKVNQNIEENGFIAIIEEAELLIKASTGKFNGILTVDACFENDNIKILHEVMQKREIKVNDNKTIVPLCVGEEVIGIIYLDKSVYDKQDIELLNIFANQAAVAIQNAKLYEMATLDPLTGVYVRRFFEQCLHRELRTSLRLKQPLSLFMIDMDGLKKINDNVGHLAGDKALSIIGKILKQSTRNSDFVGRYGGDEFSILLPLTSKDKTEIVVNRIFELLKENNKTFERKYPISLSIGICGTEIPSFKDNEYPHPLSNKYFNDMANELIKTADNLMYQAKKDTEKRFYYCNKDLKWNSFEKYML